ncbi:MAG: DNA-3-methyladenine glycosylase 2 family protein [Candidatus Doudnabacteria bacterium]|nr:DNA-3-methyladenine glycosylase 2 family protein [Candidatus Doudnabacteria bacterium]
MEKDPRAHLKKTDPVLAKIISRIKLAERKPHKRYFESLCVAIINQQLSTKAAAAIVKKFVAVFPGVKFPSSAQVLRKSDKKLRTAGLSFQKIKYIKSLAGLIENGKIDFAKFKKLTDEEIIGLLTEVKGIGRWTADMFLISCLGRPDVFSHGDYGLKKAILKWYKLDMKLHPKKYHKLVESWSPHRTTAARYLWASLN